MEKSIYNELSNGQAVYNYMTKKEKFEILSPRISIFGAGHPPTLIIMLVADEDAETDGFIARYLLFNPKPISHNP